MKKFFECCGCFQLSFSLESEPCTLCKYEVKQTPKAAWKFKYSKDKIIKK